MIFVNSCNLSKSSLNACEEKGIKETNETKDKKKIEMVMEVMVTEKVVKQEYDLILRK